MVYYIPIPKHLTEGDEQLDSQDPLEFLLTGGKDTSIRKWDDTKG